MVMEMVQPNPLNTSNSLDSLAAIVHLNLDAQTLVEQTIQRGQGKLSDQGALCIETGKFTGRSPKDRFIVEDDYTRSVVDWGDINIPVTTAVFDNLFQKMEQYLKDEETSVKYLSH